MDRPEVRDNPEGAAAANKFQGQIRSSYIANLKEKDREHFGTRDGSRGPLESLFRQLDFKPLVFGTFAESSTNVKAVLEMAMEYGVEHLGRTMAATTVEAVERVAVRVAEAKEVAVRHWQL